MEIPVLHTARLVLRAFRAADLDPYAAMSANAAVMRHLGPGVTRSREESWDAMARMLGQWPLRGYGMFALEEAGTARFVGQAGLLHPLRWDEPELAYALDRPFWGQGFATEAARALHGWAFHTLHVGSLVSYVRADNTASVNVVRKLGARQVAQVELLGAPAQKWRHMADGPDDAAED